MQVAGNLHAGTCWLYFNIGGKLVSYASLNYLYNTEKSLFSLEQIVSQQLSAKSSCDIIYWKYNNHFRFILRHIHLSIRELVIAQGVMAPVIIK